MYRSHFCLLQADIMDFDGLVNSDGGDVIRPPPFRCVTGRCLKEL